eukprot:318740-Pyramimonas_sp.AAC.1
MVQVRRGLEFIGVRLRAQVRHVRAAAPAPCPPRVGLLGLTRRASRPLSPLTPPPATCWHN